MRWDRSPTSILPRIGMRASCATRSTPICGRIRSPSSRQRRPRKPSTRVSPPSSATISTASSIAAPTLPSSAVAPGGSCGCSTPRPCSRRRSGSSAGTISRLSATSNARPNRRSRRSTSSTCIACATTSTSPRRRARSCTRRCAPWSVRWCWSGRASGHPTMSPPRSRSATARPARRSHRPTDCIWRAWTTSERSSTEIPIQNRPVDGGEGGEVGHRRALVDLVHGLPDQPELEHRTIILDEARVGGAAGCGELRRVPGHGLAVSYTHLDVYKRQALHALDGELAGQRAAPADLDHVAHRRRIGRLAEQAMVEALAAFGRPLEELHGAVHRDALLVTGDQERDRSFRRACARSEVVERSRHGASDGALHVDRAAAVERVAHDLAGKGRMGPVLLGAGRHHVGVAGEHEMRARVADARIEVFDRRGPGLGEHDAMDGKARAFQDVLDQSERAALDRRDRRTAQEIAGERDRIGGGAHGCGFTRLRRIASIMASSQRDVSPPPTARPQPARAAPAPPGRVHRGW